MGSILPNVAGAEDPVNFTPAESFFSSANNFEGPQFVLSARTTTSTDPNHPLRYGVELNFEDGTICLIQFVMTTVWRIRYDPDVKSASEYSDVNT
jgi:hypothetical protein